MKITCYIERTDIETDSGYTADGVMARCSRCGHETESGGDSAVSVRRCLVLMREECPRGENNFYAADDSSDRD